MNTNRLFRRNPFVINGALVVSSLFPLSALSLPFVINEDLVGAWNNTLVAAAVWRADDADKQYVNYGNAKEYPGAKGVSAVSDDGNLNYQKGDLISAPITYISDIDLRYKGTYGIYAKARSWYDYVGENKEVPHGTMTNGYIPNQKINDDHYYDYNQFHGFEWMDYYVYGHWDLGRSRITGRLGNQSINWGESMLHLGINAFNPVNFGALGKPQVRQDDALIPVNRIYGSVTVPWGWNLEAFYALGWEASRFGGCGTFSSGADVLPDPGCNYGGAGTQYSDYDMYHTAPINNLFKPPVYNDKPGESGQFGLAAHYFVEQLDSEFGLYYVNFSSVTPTLGMLTCPESLPIPPGAPLDWICASGNGYAVVREWSEDVKGLAISATTGISNVALSAELSQFRDLPVQRNFPTMNGAQTVKRGIYADKIVPGAPLPGNYKVDRTQLLMGFNWDLGSTPGISDINLVGEAAFQWIDDLPSTDEERLGRSGLFGEARYPDGYCNTQTYTPNSLSSGGLANVSCAVDGFVTDFSWGYRLLATGNIPFPSVGMDLTPILAWNHDVEGYSSDGSQSEGRQNIALRVRGVLQRRYFVEIGRTFFNLGGDADYDTSTDRETYSLAAGLFF